MHPRRRRSRRVTGGTSPSSSSTIRRPVPASVLITTSSNPGSRRNRLSMRCYRSSPLWSQVAAPQLVAGSPEPVRELTGRHQSADQCAAPPRGPTAAQPPRWFGAPQNTAPQFVLLLFERRLQYELPTAARACVQLVLQPPVLDPGHSIGPLVRHTPSRLRSLMTRRPPNRSTLSPYGGHYRRCCDTSSSCPIYRTDVW